MVLIAGLVMGAGCAHHEAQTTQPMQAQEPTLFTAEGKTISPAKLAAATSQAAYILLGEGHTSACHHLGQARVIRALAEQKATFAVGLEMVAQDMQPVLDRWNADNLSVSGLASALEWQSRWGHPFKLYRPVFEVCQKYKLPLVALNIPRHVVAHVRKHGLEGLPQKDQHYIPQPVIPVSDEQQKALARFLAMHAKMRGANHPGTRTFFLVQALWDTAMAEAAVKFRKKTGTKMVLLAGAGHVEYGWGIAARLKALEPKARVVSILPAQDTAQMEVEKGDYYYLCPSRDRGQRLGLMLGNKEGGELVVKAVAPGSRAEKAGFKPGDVVRKAGDNRVRNGLDLHKAALTALREQRSLVVWVIRQGESKKLEVSF